MTLPATPNDDAADRRRVLTGWFVRRRSPGWTAGDEADFQRWLAVPGHAQDYRRWEADWALMDHLPVAAAARLRAQVTRDRAGLAAGQAPRRRALVAGLAMAGVAGCTAAGWLGWQQWQSQPIYRHAWQTRRGQLLRVNLPDATVLQLDAATALEAVFARSSRRVSLREGLAVFSVQADAGRPFTVTVGPVLVIVAGTRFSVRRTPDVPGRTGVEVAVAAGRVRLTHAADAGVIELLAGQRAVFDPASATPSVGPASAEDILPPQDLLRSFTNVPLDQALAEMARYADLGLAPPAPAVAQLRLTGTFDLRNPQGARRLLAQALSLRLVPGAEGLQLQPAR